MGISKNVRRQLLFGTLLGCCLDSPLHYGEGCMSRYLLILEVYCVGTAGGRLSSQRQLTGFIGLDVDITYGSTCTIRSHNRVLRQSRTSRPKTIMH